MQKLLFLLMFVGFLSFAQKIEVIKKKDFFVPSVVRNDLRLSCLYDMPTINDKIFRLLEKEVVKYSYFSIIRDVNAKLAPARIKANASHFVKARREHPNSLSMRCLEGIQFVESYGRNNLCSPANCCGPMQFSKSTGKRFGAVLVDTVWVTVKTKNGTLAKRKKVRTRDFRNYPEYAIVAAGNYLAYMEDSLGNWELAVQGYHSGEENIRQIVELYAQEFVDPNIKLSMLDVKGFVKASNLDWSKIYFSAKPGTKLYAKIMSMKDRSHDYFFRVLAASDLLSLSKEKYSLVCDSFLRVPGTNGKRPLSRYDCWYTSRQVEQDNVLVPMRATDGLMIVAKNSSAPATTIGASMVFVSLLRKSFQKSFSELKITFASVCAVDVLGGRCEDSFDIEIPTNSSTKQKLTFVLKRMSELNFLSYQETGGRYHVVISPREEHQQIFERAYTEALAYSK